MLPGFRPDKALIVNAPAAFNRWIEQLSAAANVDVNSFGAFLIALKRRHDFPRAGLPPFRPRDEPLLRRFSAPRRLPPEFSTRRGAAKRFPRIEHSPVHLQPHGFLRPAHDAKRGWIKQLHLGAIRNNNARLLKQLGPDTGFDGVGDWAQAQTLAAYLDRLDSRRYPAQDPIIYNVNPADNYAFAAVMATIFRTGRFTAFVQFETPGWWFLDQKEGMEWQMNALSNCGLLSRFIGMITDSRSFMSYPRHEYFRRTLCNLVGRDIENGEIPDDEELVGPMIKNICYANAKNYMAFPGVK